MSSSRSPSAPSALAKVTLGHGPLQREAVAGPDLEGGAKGVDCRCGVQGRPRGRRGAPRGVSKVVLSCSPLQRYKLTNLKALRAAWQSSIARRSGVAVASSRSPRVRSTLERLLWVIAQSSGKRSHVKTSSAASKGLRPPPARRRIPSSRLLSLWSALPRLFWVIAHCQRISFRAAHRQCGAKGLDRLLEALGCLPRARLGSRERCAEVLVNHGPVATRPARARSPRRAAR